MPRKRTDPAARTIEPSRKGRVYWKPGEPHPLDVLDTELTEVRQRLTNQVAHLTTTASHLQQALSALLQALQNPDDATALFTLADRAARDAIHARFHHRKHYHHLLTAFTLQRNKRLLGRLHALDAALQLASGLLAEETSLTALPTSKRDAEDETLPTAIQELSQEELRVQGLEPLTDIVGTSERDRQLLRNFEARLPELRRELATGQGWFEIFYVPKRTYKPEVLAYAKALAASRKRTIPLPPHIEAAIDPDVAHFLHSGATDVPTALREKVYDIIHIGPYVKYRWTENKQTYTISLGLDNDYPPFPFLSQGF